MMIPIITSKLPLIVIIFPVDVDNVSVVVNDVDVTVVNVDLVNSKKSCKVSSRDSSLIWPSSLTRRVLFPRILARAPVISFSTLSRVATMVSTLVRSISLGDTNLFPTKMSFLCGLGNLQQNWITIHMDWWS